MTITILYIILIAELLLYVVNNSPNPPANASAKYWLNILVRFVVLIIIFLLSRGII